MNEEFDPTIEIGISGTGLSEEETAEAVINMQEAEQDQRIPDAFAPGGILLPPIPDSSQVPMSPRLPEPPLPPAVARAAAAAAPPQPMPQQHCNPMGSEAAGGPAAPKRQRTSALQDSRFSYLISHLRSQVLVAVCQ